MSSAPAPSEDTVLSDLESDLASLASHAAIELDNLLLGRNDAVEAVQRLASEISKLISSVRASPASLLNPATAIVLKRAIGDSKLTRLDELVNEAGRITERLNKVLKDPTGLRNTDPEELRRLRTFCLALCLHWDEEIDEQSVRDRYLVGMLAPKSLRRRLAAEEEKEKGAGTVGRSSFGQWGNRGMKAGESKNGAGAYRMTVVLSRELRAEIAYMSAKLDKSLSDVVRDAIRAYVPRVGVPRRR